MKEILGNELYTCVNERNFGKMNYIHVLMKEIVGHELYTCVNKRNSGKCIIYMC